jgi:undecaprenyl-diphosphatase
MMPTSDQPSPRPPGRRPPRGVFTRWVEYPVRRVIEWIGRHEASVLAAMLLGIVCVWGFVEVADEVGEGDTQQFDEWAVRAMRRADDPAMPIGPPFLHEVGRDLTALGGIAVLTLMVGGVLGFLWLRKMYGAAWLVLLATSTGLVASLLLKQLFQRDRPSIVPHLSIVSTSSFPSGHSMLSAVVYLTLGALLTRFVQQRRLKAYFLLVAFTLTFLVGVSRVYLGVHYPTDVLAGWSAGLAWALGCWLVARYLQRRGAVEDAAEAR